MLDIMRKSAGSWMIKFILGAIIIVFVFWGVGTFRSERASAVANVNGEKILLEDYRWAYSNTIERYQQMFGGRIPEKFMDQFNFPQIVLDSLINEVLMRQSANNMGIMISDEEVKDSILTIPSFQVKGVFDQTLYEKTLSNAKLTPSAFEGQIRQFLLTEKIKVLLNAGLFVPEDEILSHYQYRNQEINLAYLKFNIVNCEKDVKTKESELQSWYEDHKDKYLTLPSYKIKYLAFLRPEYVKEIDVTDQEIKNYYDEHRDEFTNPEERNARHILIKVAEGADEKKAAEIKEKAVKIYDKVKAGSDFAKMAKEYSEDITTAKNGGDLGFFPKGIMDKSFEDAVFALKEGEISQPVRSIYGYHIIKLEKIRPEMVKNFEEVKSTISEKLKGQKAERRLWEEANNAYDEIIQMGGMDEYAKRHGIQSKETGFFDKNSPPEIIKGKNEAVSSIISLKKGELSSLIPVQDGVIITELMEIKEPYVKPMEAVKEQIIYELKQEKARTACKEKAEKALNIAKKKGLAEAAKEYGLQVEETGFFKGSDKTVSRKLPPPALQAGFSLNKNKAIYDSVVESGPTFFLISLSGQMDGDLSGLEAQKEKIREELLQEKQRTVFMEWLEHLRKEAKIEKLMEL